MISWEKTGELNGEIQAEEARGTRDEEKFLTENHGILIPDN
jgi:hypothetical protein